MRYVDDIRHTKVYSLPGLHCNEIRHLVRHGSFPELRYVDIVIIHVGTCDIGLNKRELYLAITDVLWEVRRRHQGLKVIWSQMLPRIDKNLQTNYKIYDVNAMIKLNRFELGIYTVPVQTSFFNGNYVLRSLYKEDGIHPTINSSKLIIETLRQHLIFLRNRWHMVTRPVNAIPIVGTKYIKGWRQSFAEDLHTCIV